MTFTKEFQRLRERVNRDYLGKSVQANSIKTYGVKYNQKDILPLTKALAKTRGIQIDKFVKWNKEVNLNGK